MAAAHTNRKPKQNSLEKDDEDRVEATSRADVNMAATTAATKTPVSSELMDSFLPDVARALAHILEKYEMEEEAKSELKALVKHVSTEAERREKWMLGPKAQAKVSTVHLTIR